VTDRGPGYEAFVRLTDARSHLTLTSREAYAKLDQPLRDLLAACRATAFAETDPERRAELADVAKGLEALQAQITSLNGRAMDVTRSGWTPRGEETEGGPE
jgi:hypothetical protein